MKQVVALILALMLLSACQAPPRIAQVPAPSPPPPPSLKQVRTLDEHAQAAALEQATALLRRLTLDTTTSLPDALLNRTRCFLFAVPNRAEMLSSCRSAAAPYTWSSPELLSWRGPQRHDSVFLILVVSDGAARAVKDGKLDLADFKSAAGRTQAQDSLLTERDLGYDIFTYSYGHGSLSGAQVAGVVRRDLPPDAAEIPGGGHEGTSTGAAPNSVEYVSWVKSYFNTITPSGIIIHHSAIIPEAGKVPRTLDDIEDYHAQRGMYIECFGREYHVAYHYLIFPDGKVQPGRPERCEGAHARGYNSFIGISLVGDFSSADNPRGAKGPAQPSKSQLRSLVRLTRELQAKYKIPVQRILRHSDVTSTLCPGDRFAFRSYLAAVERSNLR